MSDLSYADTLTDSLCWLLNKKRPFIINDEYKVELLYIDHDRNRVKIKITNLKTLDEVIHGCQQ